MSLKLKNETDKINWINGFLEAMGMINSFINDGKTLEIKKVKIVNEDFRQTILDQFDPDYKIKFIQIENPEQRLNEITPFYFNTFILQIVDEVITTKNGNNRIDYNDEEYINAKTKINQKFNSNKIEKEITNVILSIIGIEDEFYELDVNWDEGEFYQCYHNDFAIVGKKRIILIHFGGSD